MPLSVPVHAGIVHTDIIHLPKIKKRGGEEADFTNSNLSHFGQESKVYGDKANVASKNDTKNDIQTPESMQESTLRTDLQQFPLSA